MGTEKIKEIARYKKEGVSLKSSVEKLREFSVREGSPPTHYVQFSDINKLGINPRTEYETPLGIYAYPVNDAILRKLRLADLPFAQERKYIILFKPDESLNILYSDLSNEDKEKYIERLIQVSSFSSIEEAERALPDAHISKTGFNFLGELWFASYILKMAEAVKKLGPDSEELEKDEVLIWSKLFRSSGIDGVSDSLGTGVIHKNEPMQAVFFSRRNLQVVEVLKNDMTPEKLYDRPFKLLSKILKKVDQSRMLSDSESKWDDNDYYIATFRQMVSFDLPFEELKKIEDGSPMLKSNRHTVANFVFNASPVLARLRSNLIKEEILWEGVRKERYVMLTIRLFAEKENRNVIGSKSLGALAKLLTAWSQNSEQISKDISARFSSMTQKKIKEDGSREEQGEKIINLLPPGILSKLGSYLGGGTYGEAYQFDKDRVIKLEFAQKKNIDPYFSMLGFFKDEKPKHIAEVYDYGLVEIPEGIIRKLTGTADKKRKHPLFLTWTITEELDPLTAAEASFFSDHTYFGSEKDLRKLKSFVCSFNSNRSMFYRRAQKINLDKEQINKIYKFISFVIKNHNTIPHFDQHFNNVMKDSAGEYKIIDHSGFMKKFNLLSEAQKIKEVTRYKKEGVELEDQLAELEKYSTDLRVARERPSYFIHFTDLNKLGINPKNKYKTPYGIYSYPVQDYILRQASRVQLPFAQHRKYMILFKPNSEMNLLDNRLTKDEYERYKERMFDVAGIDKASLLSIRPRYEPDERALVKTPLGKLWHTAVFISNYQLEQGETKSSTVAMRKLFRSVGIDGVVDYYGRGVIHKNERIQAVFFSKSGLEIVKVFENKLTSDRISVSFFKKLEARIDDSLIYGGGTFNEEKAILAEVSVAAEFVKIRFTLKKKFCDPSLLNLKGEKATAPNSPLSDWREVRTLLLKNEPLIKELISKGNIKASFNLENSEHPTVFRLRVQIKLPSENNGLHDRESMIDFARFVNYFSRYRSEILLRLEDDLMREVKNLSEVREKPIKFTDEFDIEFFEKEHPSTPFEYQSLISKKPELIKKILPKKFAKRTGNVLGAGSYGTVFNFSKGAVIKYEFATTRDLKSRLDPFFSYLGYFRDNDVPHVVRVYDYGVFPIGKEYFDYGEAQNVFIVYTIMEKVRDLNSEQSAMLKDVQIARILRVDKEALNSIASPKVIKTKEELLDSDRASYFARNYSVSLNFVKQIRELIIFAQKNQEFMVHFDPHHGNIAQTKDGELVFIDHSGFLKDMGIGVSS